MAINVIDFHREKEDGKTLQNPFLLSLHGPSFCILAEVKGKRKEFILKLSGEIECPLISSLKDFETEGYQNYLIITNFLLGDYGQQVRENWGFTKEDFREFIFGLYFCLLKRYATCGFFKKAILVLIGKFKFYAGRKLK